MRLVRIQKEGKLARGTYKQEGLEVGTGQNVEGRQISKEHLQPGKVRGQDWSGHEKKVSQQGVLTNWRGWRLELVRTWKESKLVRGTYLLERSEVRTGQNTEQKQASDRYSPPGENRGQNLSGYQKRASQQ